MSVLSMLHLPSARRHLRSVLLALLTVPWSGFAQAQADGTSGLTRTAAIGPFSQGDVRWLCRAVAIERGTGACESIQDADLRKFCLAAADRNRRSGGGCATIESADLKRACEGASGPRSYGACETVVDADWRELCRSWYSRNDSCAQVQNAALREVCRTANGVVWRPRSDACAAIGADASEDDAVIAPGPRRATQSSTDFGGDAARAIDGNRDGNWNAGSVTHSARENYPWWQLDLGKIDSVAQIRLYNRSDCCAERLSNFYVFASELPFASNDPTTTFLNGAVWHAHIPGAAGSDLTLNVGRQARYVRVQLADKDSYLSLAEVEVSLGPLPPAEPNDRVVRIDFDRLRRGDVVRGQLRGQGVDVSGFNRSGQSLAIGQVLDVNQVDSGVSPFGGSAPQALLYGVVGDLLRFDFVMPDGAPGVSDFVSIRVGDGDTPSESFRVSCFDASGKLIGSQERTTGSGAIDGGATVDFRAQGIHRVEVLGIGTDTGGAVDDLRFREPLPPGD